MRVVSFAGVALAILALSACGRSTSGVQRVPLGESVAATSRPVTALPRKTPGQARLTALEARREAVSRDNERAPVATYSRYDGRKPSDASVPRDVRETAPKLASLLPRQDVDNERPTPKSKSGRDIVDLGLEKAEPAPPRQPEPQETVVALASAPAPIPRPVAVSPNPPIRPTIRAAAPPQPPKPSIAALRSPVLSVPYGMQDRTPTGLPQFGSAPSANSGIPLGTIPASLGAANIRAAEAAIPAADELEQSSADESGAIGWDEAAALIRAGEVETFADIGEFEVLLTLCSGRGVISIQPTPGAISEVTPPKVICGKSASLPPQ